MSEYQEIEVEIDDDDDDEKYEGEDIEMDEQSSQTAETIAVPLIPKKEPFQWSNVRERLLSFLYQNPGLINAAKTSVVGLIDFLFGKDTPPSILTGSVMSIIDIVKNSHFEGYYSLVSAKKGYVSLAHKSTNIAFLFLDVLELFPHKTIKFLDNSHLIRYTLPMGDVYLYTYVGGTTTKEHYIYYNKHLISHKALLDFLSEQKIKLLDSKFILLSKETEQSAYTITAFTPLSKSSQVAHQKLEHLKKFIDAGMHRLILFYGPAGTGKSSLASFLLAEMNYKTLVFNASYKVGASNIIDYVVDVFGIEAIIMDDFDQLTSSNDKLELLESLNKRLKVVIGVANSLKEFHPALLRPGRFDEVSLINELDKECILGVLGENGNQYYEQVKHWPIAYIQELSKRIKLLPEDKIEIHIEDLNDRVKRQLVKLS